MLKNNLRLELETIHHDPRRQAGRMTKSSSANRPQTEYGGASVPHLSGTEQIVRKTPRKKKSTEGQCFNFQSCTKKSSFGMQPVIKV